MSGRVWQSLRQRGVTLIEAVLFIAIALGLVVGGLVFYQQASLAQRVGRMVDLSVMLISEANALAVRYPITAQEFWNSVGGGQNDLADFFVQMGAVPAGSIHTFSSGISVVVHPWRGANGSGRIQVRVQANAIGGQSAISLTFLELPWQACGRIIAFDADGKGIFGNSGQAMVNFLQKDSNSLTGWSQMPGYQSMGRPGGVVAGISKGDAVNICREARPEGIAIFFWPGSQ